MLRIAVIKTDGIGDAVLASPFLFELRNNFGDAHITGFLSPAGAQVLGGLNVLDEVAVHDAKWLKYKKVFFPFRWLSALGLLLKIRKGKFDIVIGLRWQDRLTSLIVSLCGAKDRYGYDTAGMGFGINHKIPVLPAGTHVIERNMEVLRQMLTGRKFRIKMGVSSCRDTACCVTHGKDKAYLKKYIVIHPVSGCPAKDWPVEKYRALALKLSKRMPVYIIGAKNDRGISTIKGKNIINTAGRPDIRGIASLVKGAAIVIGNDSAAVHMAAAFNVRSLTLFSGTADVREWGAYGKKSYIITAAAACKNCGLSECEKSGSCCLDFGVDEVYRTASRILGGKEAKKVIALSKKT